MNKRMSVGALLGAAILAVTGAVNPAAAAGNLIKNGTFSAPAAPAGGVVEFYDGESIGDWQVAGADARGGVTLYSRALTQYTYQAVDIGAGSISQEFEADTGSVVNITWKHARNTDPSCAKDMGEQSYSAQVIAPTGDPVGDSYNPIGPRFASVNKSLQFIAGDDDRFTLEFTGRAPEGCGPLITDVVAKVIGHVVR
ncbi:hypothetical protein GCM10010400_38380 [Streptomyces aculeolatus]|uniref:hypothetical protein n=1 Tax=Streptomyces aculeolatus TaxID=270689 RepID=UPI001CECDB86|nr:hypothetical protein [Streptomyces aculeolatus]